MRKQRKIAMSLVVMCAFVAMSGHAMGAVLVSDDFQDGDYTNNPAWVNDVGTMNIITDSPGTTDGNIWVYGGDSHTTLKTPTGITSASPYTEVTVTARVIFTRFATDRWAGLDFVSDDGNSYIRANIYPDSQAKSNIYVRKNSSTTLNTPYTTSGITALNTWYDVKLVWKNTNEYEMYVNNNLISSGSGDSSVIELGDFTNVRLYTRASVHSGFDDVVVSAIPEPATLLLLGSGALVSLVRKKRTA